MSLDNPSAGFQNVQEFIAPGLPYVYAHSGSFSVEFPYITRSFTVSAMNAQADVYFSGSMTSDRKFVVPANTSQDFPLRIVDMWVNTSGSATVCAALTTIPRQNFPRLDGWVGI